MKKIFILIVLVLSFGSASAAVEKPLGAEEFTSLEEIATNIASYFPKVQGEVKAVQGDNLTIGLGTKNGLVPGVTLTLWRDGREIHHPVTGQVLGRAEDEVGTADIVSLAETTCTALLREKMTEPEVGDKARITPKKINLALLPVRADRPEITQGLQEKLSDLGRFSVLGSDKVAAFLKDKKQRDSSLIKEMSKAYDLDVIVAIGIYPSEGNKLLVTAKLFYADEARPLDTVVALLDLKSKSDAYGELKPFFVPPSVKGESAVKEASDLPELPFAARFMASADFEGTGSRQYVFSDGEKLHVYKKGTAWSEEWKEPGSYVAGEMQHINLDVADINGNGRPQIFVTAMRNGKVFSSVVEFRNGTYQRIAEIPGFLRVIKLPGKGNILVGQDYDPGSFFSGQPKQYVWSDGRYTAGPELSLPPGLKLYGFVFAQLGEAEPSIVALDDKEHIVVYSHDEVVWKSEETYPAFKLSVQKAVTGAAAVISDSVAQAEKSQKVRIPGRIATLDINGIGRDEIVLPKNSGGTFFSDYTDADFISLGWTGTRLETRWSVRSVGGAVLDFQINQLAGTGARIVALVKSSGGLLASDHIRVMSYAAK
jgi:hypothetical protein